MASRAEIIRAWAERAGVTPEKASLLMQLASNADYWQVRWHNEGDIVSKETDRAIKKVEDWAKDNGFKSVLWPGTWPVLVKQDNSNVHLPEV